MSILNDLKKAETPTDTSTSLMNEASIDMRNEFQKWLVDGNAKKISPQVAIDCLDRISEYIISKKIACSIWEISNINVYKPVYQKILNAKLLRIIERKTYKTFTLVGQLYMSFLREKPWETYYNNSEIATTHSEQPTQNQLIIDDKKVDQTVIAQAQNTADNLLFRKDVDLSLLKYGFTIPQSAIGAFCSNISIEVPRGGSHRISLVVKDHIYSATLSNVGFSSETRQQMQVRYSQMSPIAKTLRSIFAASNALFIAGKQAKNKEYIEVSCVSTDKFELICHPIKFESTIESEYSSVGYNANSDLKSDDYVRNQKGQQSNDVDHRKYAPLKQWLMTKDHESIILSFSDIANMVGGLPPSAYNHRAFWSNTSSHPFSVAWMEAGYKVVDCDLQSQNVSFVKVGKENEYTRPTNRMTIKAAMIKYSNDYAGEIKTRKEICDELSAKYGFPRSSILPADYEISLSNHLPKLFRRIGHGTYECLGYSDGHETNYRNLSTRNYTLNAMDQERIKYIIATKFRNGYRITSSIDFERLKNYYTDEYSENFNVDAEGLDAFVKSVAVIFDDRAYVYDEEIIVNVRTFLEQMDSPCVYIDTFFEKYSGELYNFGIFSVNMLRAFIEKNYADIFCKWGYVYLQPDVSPSDLIRQVFNERESWSFDELVERLPCIKQDTIRAALNGPEYFRIGTGVYTHIDNLDLPDSEGEKIVSFVRERLQSKDYVIANELDLSYFEALNPHCPFPAIRDAVYNKFLANQYSKSGQIITSIGKKLRVLDILEQYCREAETASFEELNSFEATFDPEGRSHSACLIAAHNVMVRVSEDLFVAESKVSFDVERIDEAIALYCRDNFIPLKSVADFSLFPYAGYHWNLFLLESYVRKFSRLFKYDVRAVNSANIGVIVRKSFTYGDYDDILPIALAKSSLSLNDKKAAGDYLFDNGYIGWRNLGKNESKILANAKKLREGGAV